MSPTIFVTGISGYIGGHVTTRLVAEHPDYAVRALVRTSAQAEVVKAQLPSVTPVIGDLDMHDLIVEESAKADVVLNMASADHLPVITSALDGLSKGKGAFIHTSGTGVLADFAPQGPGYPTAKTYSDVADIRAVTSLPMTAVHRDTDDAVITRGLALGVRTAIVSPPTVYGVGRGPLKRRSLQIPWLVEAVLKRGRAFTVQKGGNWWDCVHVDDLADAYVLLVGEALKEGGGEAAWGADGYYFAESGEYQWATATKAIGAAAHAQGALKTADVDELAVSDAAAIHPWAPLLWGSNCRGRADRLRALGWDPKVKALEENIAEMVRFEIGGAGATVVKATFDK